MPVIMCMPWPRWLKLPSVLYVITVSFVFAVYSALAQYFFLLKNQTVAQDCFGTSPQHLRFQAAAACGLVIYSFGIPAFLYCLLYRLESQNGCHQLHSDQVFKIYGFWEVGEGFGSEEWKRGCYHACVRGEAAAVENAIGYALEKLVQELADVYHA